MPSPKIAIIGAGPVGTTLGRLLLRQSPSTSVTIFESEPSPNYRSQGGTLDLHTETGLAAIKEAGLWDEFSAHARYDGESLLMTDKNLKPFWQVKPSASPQQKGGHLGGQRPEIDRAALRQILAESLPDDMITWGHRLKEVRPGNEPRSTKLVFNLADGGTTTASGFDLIVGAEGAWSKVRGVLSDVKPVFSGVSCHAFEIPDAENTAPEVYRTVNRGSVFSHADGLKTNLQQLGDGSICVYLNFQTDDEDWYKKPSKYGYDAWDLEQSKAAALKRYADWHPIIREAISRTQGRPVPRSLYMLPVGFSFEHRAGLTIIGDAAHLMTPFAGEGVNVGMEDARRLAAAVVAAGGDLAKLDREVAAFEKDMFERAGEFAGLTQTMLRAWFFTADCPRSVVPKALSTHASFHAPWLLKPLVGGLAYSYFSVRNKVTSK
ncbi:tetracycline resistance protein from transposon [Diaporthe amygdali]|uniref:tetracycline resistance protein from transposon n=1 Tax=Phomopsis amygdali TaxID=1214568 RepID=UPI0022FEB851|nr:tetracycline resistance protein from transposon [Diaporthe amygdali]KAJ0124609.1 tetracycline resistance protein from transposon [Diaporthe amygdali]